MVVKIGGFLDQLFTLMNNITILERFVHPFQSYRVHFMVPYKFHAFTVGVDDWQATAYANFIESCDNKGI